MFQLGQEMFVSVGGGDNALEPVTVCNADGGAIALRFVDDGATGESVLEGQYAMLYFNGPDGFMQQPARIVEPKEGGRSFLIETTGDAVSGESRQFFRVCTVLVEYFAGVGDEDSCRIVDVSSMGLAIVSGKELSVGDCVPVSFPVGKRTFSGECIVQSVRETKGGWRCGLLCINGEDSGALDEGLHGLTMDAQCTQLKRLSGAA